MIALDLLPHCAPEADPRTVAAIVQVESGGDPNALHVNGLGFVPVKERGAAIAAAKSYIAAGYSVDMGYMQVNSRTALRFGYSVAQLFDPCANLAAGAHVLAVSYAAAVRTRGPGQSALQAALSAYNTGNGAAGFQNGYVGRYYRHAVAARLSPFNAPSPVSFKGGLP